MNKSMNPSDTFNAFNRHIEKVNHVKRLKAMLSSGEYVGSGLVFSVEYPSIGVEDQRPIDSGCPNINKIILEALIKGLQDDLKISKSIIENDIRCLRGLVNELEIYAIELG